MADGDDVLWVGSMPEVYDRQLGPVLFQPYAIDLARRVAASSPGRVLEVAAGTGIVTHELIALLPDAAVTATDLNEAMVERGAAKVPAAVWRQADALELPFADDTFDVVACQFGVMFFPDRARAFREAARVLAPGGRFVFNVWGPLDRNELGAAVQQALAAHFPDDPPGFLPSVPYGYHDRSQVAADLTAGGLAIESWDVVTTAAPAVAQDAATGFFLGTPVRAEIVARSEDLDAAVEAMVDAVTRQLGAEPAPRDLAAVVVEARHLP
jgi:SAM-dependent methyltransferase